MKDTALCQFGLGNLATMDQSKLKTALPCQQHLFEMAVGSYEVLVLVLINSILRWVGWDGHRHAALRLNQEVDEFCSLSFDEAPWVPIRLEMDFRLWRQT